MNPFAEWNSVLHKVQQFFPGAVIAGGALRDFIGGVVIKDVDIFIPETRMDVIEEIILREFPDAVLDPIVSYVGTSEADDRDLVAVYDLGIGEWAYQLIFGTNEACDANNFDINICQIVYDGKHLHFTKAFADGMGNGVIEVLNVNRVDRNKARLERLRVKYPNFEVRCAE